MWELADQGHQRALNTWETRGEANLSQHRERPASVVSAAAAASQGCKDEHSDVLVNTSFPDAPTHAVDKASKRNSQRAPMFLRILPRMRAT